MLSTQENEFLINYLRKKVKSIELIATKIDERDIKMELSILLSSLDPNSKFPIKRIEPRIYLIKNILNLIGTDPTNELDKEDEQAITIVDRFFKQDEIALTIKLKTLYEEPTPENYRMYKSKLSQLEACKAQLSQCFEKYYFLNYESAADEKSKQSLENELKHISTVIKSTRQEHASFVKKKNTPAVHPGLLKAERGVCAGKVIIEPPTPLIDQERNEKLAGLLEIESQYYKDKIEMGAHNPENIEAQNFYSKMAKNSSYNKVDLEEISRKIKEESFNRSIDSCFSGAGLTTNQDLILEEVNSLRSIFKHPPQKSTIGLFKSHSADENDHSDDLAPHPRDTL